MTPPPVLGAFGQALLDAVLPLAYADADPEVDYGTQAVVGALSAPFETIYEWALEDELGRPGWSSLVDLPRIPAEALPWASQLVGVRLLPGTTEEQQRIRIAGTDGMKRGTPGALRTAAQRYLIGDQQVIFRERYDPANPTLDKAYHLTILTLDDETSDPDAVVAAIALQKPAGIILHYSTVSGQDWQEVLDSGDTWADVLANYDDWADVAGTF